MAGPKITLIMAGRMNRTSGNRILTVVLAALSSARSRRVVRMVSEIERSAGPICAPSFSLCTRVAGGGLMSSAAVRTAELFSSGPLARHPGAGERLDGAARRASGETLERLAARAAGSELGRDDG